MHELSICGALLDTVEEHAAGASVRQVNLRIGHFRQVVPETLQYCWEMRTSGSRLDGCVLEITSVPAVIECASCGQSSTLTDPILVCHHCGSSDATLTSGDEFLIESIDLTSTTAETSPRPTASKETH